MIRFGRGTFAVVLWGGTLWLNPSGFVLAADATPAASGPLANEPPSGGAEPAPAAEPNTEDGLTKDKGTEVIGPPSAQGSRIVGAFVSAAGEVEMGSGTFVLNESSRNEYVAWNAALVPGYQFSDRTRVQLLVGISQELTQNDGDSSPHRLLLSDLRLSVSRPLIRWDSTKTQIVGDLGAVAPISLRSRFEGLYTSLGASLQLQQPVGDFFFSFRTAFRKNFHRYTTPILSEDDLAADGANGLRTELARENGNERVSAGIAVGMQNNVSHTWSNQLLAAYSFSDAVSLTVVYALAHGWGYESYPRDELTAEGAQGGSRRGDSSAAEISLSYQALDTLNLATGVRTLTTPRTADDKALRFPFYEFSNAELNLSVFYVSVTLTERIPF